MSQDRGVKLLDTMTPADKQALRDNATMGRALRELYAATKDLLSAFRAPYRKRRRSENR